METVLLIEDDVSIQKLVSYNLEKEGFKVVIAGDGQAGLDKANKLHPDAILLDLMLPVVDGYDVCRSLRANSVTVDIPVIILSARGEVLDKVLGLELGADDYMAKPFSPRELSARIRARIRRARARSGNEHSRLVINELELWPQGYSVKLSGQNINFSVKEFQLLYLIAEHPHQVFSREYLLARIWDYHSDVDTRTVDVHVSNIRHKLKALGNVIEAVRGVGYRFIPPKEKN